MSIPKIVKPSGPLEVIDRETLQAITDAEVLGAWVYLQTLPEEASINPDVLREHFGMGSHKIRRIMRTLRSMGLISDAFSRDDEGKITGRDLVIGCTLHQASIKLRSACMEASQ